ncbi:MAG: NAD(P)H-binding protein [Caulobacteraceae bacterium]|nr:NAD(P)H-binding protein [Caulobacteraceae bacterium]
MSQSPQRIALVIGAGGAFGRHAVLALASRGWRIRALARDAAGARARFGGAAAIDWVQGDAMDPAAVLAAAGGVRLVIHAANPPGYRNWKGTVLPMADNALAAAGAAGARLVIAGSVYNFAPDAGAAIAETAPQGAITRKGRIRVELERRLREAASQGAKVLVLRAGDFFGPEAPATSLGWLTIRRGGRLRGIYAPGRAAHAFAYLPDLAETLARLLEREAELADFEVFHFRGCWSTASELAAAIRRAAGQPALPLRPFPWMMIRALSPFVETFRELLEMRYLWDRPIGLANAKLVGFLGEEPHTPLETALRATLGDMGVLGSGYPASRSSSAIAQTM